MVLKEGISDLSVRKIGEAAGFSYATIYNYFKDLNHLLWHVTMSFINDITGFLGVLLGKKPFFLADAQTLYRAYSDYFLERPNVFQLLFFGQIGEAPPEFAGMDDKPELAESVLINLEASGECCPLNDSDKRTAAALLTSSVHGMLLLRITGKSTGSKELFLTGMDAMLEFLIRKLNGCSDGGVL